MTTWVVSPDVLFPGILALLSALLGLVVWIVRLDSKVELARQLAENVLERLDRIERLLDSLVKFNGTH